MPGSCSSGFRSRPSAARGEQALERVRGEQHEEQEADADQAHHAEHARRPSPRAGGALKQRHRRASTRRASASTAAASLRARPRRRRSGSAAAARVGVAARRTAPRNRCATKRRRRQPKANATSSELRLRRRPRERHPGGVAARRADERQHALHERHAQRERRARSGRARESFALPSSCAFVDALRLLERVRRLRAACSSRRAWRAPRARGTRRRRRAGPARPRLCPPGTGRAGCRGRRTGMVFAVSVTTKRTVARRRASRCPASTMPPMRKVAPVRRFVGRHLRGVKKNTRFCWNAFSTSAVATPSADDAERDRRHALVSGLHARSSSICRGSARARRTTSAATTSDEHDATRPDAVAAHAKKSRRPVDAPQIDAPSRRRIRARG